MNPVGWQEYIISSILILEVSPVYESLAIIANVNIPTVADSISLACVTAEFTEKKVGASEFNEYDTLVNVDAGIGNKEIIGKA